MSNNDKGYRDYFENYKKENPLYETQSKEYLEISESFEKQRLKNAEFFKKQRLNSSIKVEAENSDEVYLYIKSLVPPDQERKNEDDEGTIYATKSPVPTIYAAPPPSPSPSLSRAPTSGYAPSFTPTPTPTYGYPRAYQAPVLLKDLARAYASHTSGAYASGLARAPASPPSGAYTPGYASGLAPGYPPSFTPTHSFAPAPAPASDPLLLNGATDARIFQGPHHHFTSVPVAADKYPNEGEAGVISHANKNDGVNSEKNPNDKRGVLSATYSSLPATDSSKANVVSQQEIAPRQYVNSQNKLGDWYSMDNAKVDLESAFGKELLYTSGDQLNQVKIAGITIRRDKEHPHLVDIVRVIREGEDLATSPDVQFVAIKGQGDDDGKTTLTIKRPGEIQETVTDKVFFRKVELKDDGDVVFSDDIYYYSSGKKKKSFSIDQIIPSENNKISFLKNLGMLKIRATNVIIENNRIEDTDTKISALNKSEKFQELNLQDHKELQPQEKATKSPLHLQDYRELQPQEKATKSPLPKLIENLTTLVSQVPGDNQQVRSRSWVQRTQTPRTPVHKAGPQI
jgi:hypothetical protein